MEDAEHTMISAIHGGRAVGRRAAWAVFVTTCAIWAAALLLDWMTRGVSSHDELGPYDIVGLVVVTLLVAFPATGLVIALRRPATPIGWLLLTIGAGWGLLLVTSGYADYGLLTHPGSLPAADVVAAVGGAVWAVPVGRTRIQRMVDHRFYRRRYDAVRTLEAFSRRLREQVDIETVSGEVLDVVRETLQSAHAALWIRPHEADA
jgi:hypothetical protein